MRASLFEKLQACRAAATPVAVLTNLRTGQQLLVTADGSHGDLCLDVDMIAAAQDAIRGDASTSFETPAGKIFVHVFAPPPRLIVVGAVHIAEPLARMGALAGYGVTIVDPRRAFAASGFYNFPTYPQLVPDLVGQLAHDRAATPPNKYAILADAADWTINVGYPGYANAAVDEIWKTWLIPKMFADAASGRMTPEAALDMYAGQVDAIYAKWREMRKV